MRSSKGGTLSLLLLVFSLLFVALQMVSSTSAYYSTSDSGFASELDDYTDTLAKLLLHKKSVHRRSCLRRGASCDNRPNDCCFSSSCRCNLWGTNCRCQRMGLFQRWGR